MVDRDTVAKELKARGFHSFGQVTTFKGYRPDASGEQRRVTVEVWETLNDDMPRYWIEARDEDGREATGNGNDSLALALQTLHWQDLDRDK